MPITYGLVFLLALPQAAGWPQYRGPERSGIGPEQDLAVEGRAGPLWSTNVGTGYSCPSIVGDHLVTIGHYPEAGVDRIVCLEPETGDERWGLEFESPDRPRYHGGGTLTTPTIDGGLVYCLSRHGELRVLDLMTGEPVWSRDYRAELGMERTFHGFSASPLLEDGRIYLQLGGRLVALDSGDGRVLWQSDDRGDASYANPARIAVDGEPALAAVLGEDLVVLRVADGALLREYPWRLTGNAVHCATPIPVGEDLLFLSTAYGKGCELLRLGEGKTPEPVWGHRHMRNKVTACVLYEGHLYGFDESMLRCIDLDGESRWQVRGLGLGSLSIVDDRLLVLSSDGELIVADADPGEYRELSRRKVLDGGEYWTMPVAVGGLVYVRNSLGDLVCLDHRPVAAAPDTDGASTPEARPTPTAADLFARHAASIDGAALDREGEALELRGTWSVPLRGLDAGEMTWTLVAPDRWDLRLDTGTLLYTHDGERSWAIEPQGPRMIEGDELFEARRLFPLPTLFAPPCPSGAEVDPRPTRFAETECWRVTSPLANPAGGAPGTLSHYFSVDTGALVGTEGDGLSTLVFRGSQRLDGTTLPESVTRFRAEDGQEHTLVIATARWIAIPPDLFQPPAAIRRLLRSDTEIARDEAALRRRFGDALARYRPREPDTPLEDDVLELRIHDGDLWLVTPEPQFRIDVEAEEDGVFPVDGPPLRISLELGEDGEATTLRLHLPGPDGERVVPCDRLPE